MENGRRIASEQTNLEPLGYRERVPFSHQVVVATNFLYRGYRTLPEGEVRDVSDTDGVRGDLALETLTKAVRAGVRVVACDGGSSPDFLVALEKFKLQGLTVVTSDVAGRAPQRRRAFETATALPGGKVIVYIQPEKVGLIDHLAEITTPILEEQAEIVIPEREPILFQEKYPDYMWKSELRVNRIYNWIMHRKGWLPKDQNLDWFFGAVVFKNDPEIVSLFLKRYTVSGQINTSKRKVDVTPDPERNSGSHYTPIIEALSKRKRVVGVQVKFEYPESQRTNEEYAKDQFLPRRLIDADTYLIEGLHHSAYLEQNPRSKIIELKPVA